MVVLKVWRLAAWAFRRSGLWPVYPMVHMPLLHSRVMSSTTGSSLTTLMCLKSWLSKPSFFANLYMMV